MISIDQAIDIIKKNISVLDHEEVKLEHSQNRVLAQNHLAPEPSPRFDNSAMDGFAVCYNDIIGATPQSPVTLKIIGESRAGIPFAGQAEDESCLRISTGAMLPTDFDTIVRVEDTKSNENKVMVKEVRKKGQDVRYCGEEYQTGEILLTRNQKLGARHMAILAAAGADTITVFRRPRVALLVTGSELTTVSEQPGSGQIRDSNRIMLAAAVSEADGDLIHTGRVGDDIDETVKGIEEVLAASPDLIICAGGVSIGPHDHVKEAAARSGFTEHFWRVKQKPGKPLYFAGRNKTLFFGLPGNPVSAYICFCHYLKPLLGALSGQPWEYKTITAVADQDITNKGSRPNLVRINFSSDAGGFPKIHPVSHQGSHMISSIVSADGYLLMEAESKVKSGAPVEVTLLP